MQLKSFKPITPSLRHRQLVPSIPHDPFKPLVFGKAKTGFRNNRGRVTVRHRGGGHKRSLRIIDFLRLNARNTPFEILRLDYDPNRTGLLALCRTMGSRSPVELSPVKSGVWIKDKKYFYILATQDMKPGDIIYPGTTTLGSSLSLADIPVGAELCCIEANPGRGAVFARAAGSVATLLGLTNNSAIVQLPSDQVKHLPLSCRATLGRVSNPLNSQTVLGKAGASRWLGRRPRVRGEVTNPIDHPHGGKTRGGRPLKNIWGKLAKWVPTRKKRAGLPAFAQVAQFGSAFVL